MNTWTATARRELEERLAGLRLTLAGSGADPDEVVDDLRRHVAEEATAARLPIVTEVDVRRFLDRLTPTNPWRTRRRHGGSGVAVSREPSVPEEGPGGCRAPLPSPPPSTLAPLPWWRLALILFFGVLVPLGTLIFEITTRMCARELFDPLPSLWHGLLVALVPVANVAGLWSARDWSVSARRARWMLNSAAVGVGVCYVLPLLPLAPFALVAVVIGLGLLPLAPLLGLICTLSLRVRMARGEAGMSSTGRKLGWVAMGLPVVFLAGYLVPGWVTLRQAGVAARAEIEGSEASVQWLRRWGDRETLLQECYGRRRGLWDGFLPAHLPTEPAREVYFRVTGQPFNAVPPPQTAWSRRNAGVFNEIEAGGAEWDSALGSEAVAGRVRGLSLVSSRLDGMADADAAWSYVEWTLEFRNDHERSQREARAQIQLPPGGVVSRLTLWVNGEEREAAFAGRSQVREAYQKVAVQERRDPVLVTTSGPDRVLMQCFPVPPNSGTMKVRLGITSPLTLKEKGEAAMIWPTFLERNFGQSRSMTHGVWLDAPQGVVGEPAGLTVFRDDNGRNGFHGVWMDSALGDPARAVVLKRDALSAEHWAPDRRSEKTGRVRQRVIPAASRSAGRVAWVVDASEGMQGVLPEIAEAFERLPAGAELGLFIARDGVVRLGVDARAGSGSPDLAAALRGFPCEGGHDAVPALEAAWDWAAQASDGAVVWIHGPNPVLLRPVETLRQRFERQRGGRGARLWDLSVRPGPNRVLEKLDGLEAVGTVPRLGSVGSDLTRWMAVLEGRETRWELAREWIEGDPEGIPPSAGLQASSHVTRLWALGEVKRLGRGGAAARAAQLAARHQLVTPYSGAVVLETQEQYERSGLQPVDPATVPVVPEPGAVWILAAGLVVLLARRRV
ncbi:MAG: VIT domain-containing protein [Limisphaerales bacterium]